jgi:2-polyprenyl-3-methyl-5-hydroxy-6-metoxy-1,4-benzoquinol methylase
VSVTSRDNESLTEAYAGRLELRQTSRWRKYLAVQLPYRLHLRGKKLGFVLDVGCGVDGAGVGVDANPTCVEAARRRGFRAYQPDEFEQAARVERWQFDSILIAHVLEHVGAEAAPDLVRRYLRYLKPGGRVVFVTPQEAGYRSDSTHVEFIDDRKLQRLCASLRLRVVRSYSFPFPRLAGHLFTYNEFIVEATLPPA